MPDCTQYDEQLSAYLDGELTPEETEALEAHLNTCADCRDYLTLLQTMRASLLEEAPEPPASLRNGILYKIGLEEKRKPRFFRSYGRWTVIAAVLCLALLGTAKLNGGSDVKQMNGYTLAADFGRTGLKAADTDGMDGAMSEADEAETWETDTLSAIAENSYFDGVTADSTPEEESDAVYSYASAEKAAEPVPEPESGNGAKAEASGRLYSASELPGYRIGTEALDSDTAYSCVGILYSLPENCPGLSWETIDAPIGQRRWLVSREQMDALAKDGIFDELYYGDFTAETGLIIELREGAD